MTENERQLLLSTATVLDELMHFAEKYLFDAEQTEDVKDGIIAAKTIQQTLEDGINLVRREEAAWLQNL